MMDDKELGRVSHTLMVIARKPHLFPDTRGYYGPTAGAVAHYTERAGLSSGELAMLDVAMALWNRSNNTGRIATVIHTLDDRCLRAIGELFVALAEESQGRASLLVKWLLRWGATCREDCPCRGA